MTSVIVGAPVYRREWMIERWFEYTTEALKRANVDYEFAFVGDLRDPTFDYIREREEKVYVVPTREENVEQRGRMWDHDRYRRMVILRNSLLTVPREKKPTYFLSLDTDILVHPDSIYNLIESSEFFDAVGGKLYMGTHGKREPSYLMRGQGGSWRRAEANGVIQVDVIMAYKLMSQDAYNVDYKFHGWGEDIGWSCEVRKRGMRLGWDGRIASKHILEPEMLDREDVRVGY